MKYCSLLHCVLCFSIEAPDDTQINDELCILSWTFLTKETIHDLQIIHRCRYYAAVLSTSVKTNFRGQLQTVAVGN